MNTESSKTNSETLTVSSRQMRKARRFAGLITDQKPAQKVITERIQRALANFGGRIRSFEGVAS